MALTLSNFYLLNQFTNCGFVFVKMCFETRYSSKPSLPNSLPIPDCLYPPHGACAKYGWKSLIHTVPSFNLLATRCAFQYL